MNEKIITNIIEDLNKGNVVCLQGANSDCIADFIVTKIGGDFECDVLTLYVNDDFEEKYLQYLNKGTPAILILKNITIKDFLKCHYRIVLNYKGYIEGYVRPVR